ncbi:MAG: MFS transporter [Anaerolineae bacterium]|nr:MFS transporter [Anaerolineae bacterium]MCB0203752.1 MFS transporter [Anaerolineae bacterium]MCB0252420.1 MFS transporter [Anaerolineae bacterium]
MATNANPDQFATAIQPRSRGYLTYLVVFLGSIALMDSYLSSVKSSAIPYILETYGISAPAFSGIESLVLISTFFVFILNHLADVIGRKLGLLLLILGFGLTSLAIVLWTPTLPLFMVFYAAATFFTVSNMWQVPASEEAPAARRARMVTIIAAIGMLPLQAILPPIMVDKLGLNWRWMYGVQFLFMFPVLVMWLFMRETSRFQAVQEQRRLDHARRSFNLGLATIDRRDLRNIILSSAVVICILIFVTLFFWCGYFFITLNGFTLTRWSTVFLAILLMILLGNLSGGWLMDRIGRKRGLIIGCAGCCASIAGLGYASGSIQIGMVAATGFFFGISSSWTIVYIPEVFPTERRATCMGWVTAGGRISYVVGPALAALLLKTFPDMHGFWVAAGLVALLPIVIILLARPAETRQQSLEEISATH